MAQDYTVIPNTTGGNVVGTPSPASIATEIKTAADGSNTIVQQMSLVNLSADLHMLLQTLNNLSIGQDNACRTRITLESIAAGVALPIVTRLTSLGINTFDAGTVWIDGMTTAWATGIRGRIT